MRRALAILSVVAAVGATACGDDKQVGSKELLEFNEAVTTTAPPGAPVTTPPPTTAAPRQAATTTVPARTQTTAAASARPANTDFQLAITAQGFDPDSFVVKVGQRIVFTNKDSGRAHSWVANDGTWDSGPLQPGQTFVYIPNKAGVYDFKDEEVPFLIGRMEVRP